MKPNSPKPSKIRRPIRFVEQITRIITDSGFSDESLKKTDAQATVLAAYLGSNKIQAVLFSVICNLNFSNRAVGLERIAENLKCTPITVAAYLSDLEELESRKILRKEVEDASPRKPLSESLSTYAFSVNPQVLDALLCGKPFCIPEVVIRDSFELIQAIGDLVQQRHDHKISFDEMRDEVARLEDEHKKMDFISEIMKLNLDRNERILYYKLCYEYFQGELECSLTPLIRTITHDTREFLDLHHQLRYGTSWLVAKEYIAFREGFFRSDKEVYLTPKGIELVTRGDKKIQLEVQEKTPPDFLLAKDFREQNLYYSHELQEKHDFLSGLLMQEQYGTLIRRLGKAQMKTGIAILFHGPPGTGKTESAYQLARKTGRNILQVSISEMKSKWFGDSEKNIKQLFDRYRKISNHSERLPILLFNEADGILSTRRQMGSSDVRHTENAIQNIILQEMEQLDGIMIATTNLIRNLDKAFDRRFLYKIEFEKPSLEARYHIWRDKLPSLSGAAAWHFAELYDFSGGQIDNIARKFVMARVLNGKNPLQSQIESWCKEETTNGSGLSKIGFRR
jgi:hypothetical protein